VSAPVFMFYASELVCGGGTNGVGSCFHVLRSQTRFRRCEGRQILFSCFALPDSFSTVLRASAPVFMFCTSELVFDGNESVGSHFHVFLSRTCFRRCRGCRVPFSCFALPHSFSAVPWTSGPVFIFCAPGLIFDGIEGVGFCFMFCTSRLIFGGTESVGSRFHVLRVRTHFRRYQGRRVSFSCFALV
jgi:hypothetical protein